MGKPAGGGGGRCGGGGGHEVDENVKMFDKLQRQELIRLQRTYRQLGGDARSGNVENDATGKLGRQRMMAKHLINEKENLRADLVIANSLRNRIVAKLTGEEVEAILKHYDEYRHDMEEHLDEVFDIEQQLDKIIKRIINQKLRIQAIYGQAMSMESLAKIIARCQNRLYWLTRAYNSRCHINQTVRHEISECLRRRARFFIRQKWYKRAYAETKLAMNKVTETTTRRYDARDDAALKIKMLVARNDRESRLHVLEIKDLQRLLHQDEQNNSFILTKNHSRNLIEPDWARKKRKITTKFRHMEETLISYKRAFRNVLKLGRTRDLETLVVTYKTQEQKNFAMVKFLMDIYNEIMVLKTTVIQLKKDIEYHARVFNVRKRAERAVLSELIAEVAKKEKSRRGCENEMKVSESGMSSLVNTVQSVFQAAKCGNTAVVRLLGNRMGIKPNNILLCLSVLEHQVDDLKQKKTILEVRRSMKDKKATKPPPQTSIIAPFKLHSYGGPFKPKVVFTGHVGLNEDEDEEERLFSKHPFKRDEMLSYCFEKIHAAGGLETKFQPGGSGRGTARESEEELGHANKN